MAAIDKGSLDFLVKLANNNDREWFSRNKDQYISAHEDIVAFASVLLAEMNSHDNIETESGKASLFRIYKDVRFSKEKIPYNTHWSGGFKRATKQLRGGYYFHIQPGASFVAGGFWAPNAQDLQRIRQDIDLNHNDWNKMLSDRKLRTTFGTMIGDKVASAPRGYAKDHIAIGLLQHKQFLLQHHFTDKEVLERNFARNASETFKKMRPFLNYMSEILSTDANGELLAG